LPRFGVGNWTGAELASKLTTRLWPVIPILI
jgi:hypothetical protein